MAGVDPAARSLAEEIGSRVRFHRRALKNTRGTPLAQEEFAYRLQMDRSYFGRVERGDVNITVHNLVRIADGLGVDPSELVAGTTLQGSERENRSDRQADKPS